MSNALITIIVLIIIGVIIYQVLRRTQLAVKLN